MLGEAFYWVFNMSIIGSAMGLIVLLLRLIKRMPRRIFIWLWLVPYLRYCVPLWLNSRFSLMTLISRLTTKTVTVWSSAGGPEFSLTNTVMAANTYFPITYRVNLLEGLFGTAGVIWAIVTAAILIALGILYLATMREVRTAVRIKDNVYVSDRVKSPAVYGIFRPRIILPQGYGELTLEHVLLHERTHIKYVDNLWRLLAFAVTALHWFDPFAWIFLKLLLNDIELACDERAAAKLDMGERKRYALALLGYAEPKSVFTSAFGGARLRTRVENVLNFKRMTWVSAVVFTALAVMIAVTMLTNAG